MKLTTASKITVARIVLIPVVLALMYWGFPGHMYCALAVFILASLSDFVDGYIARHCNQVSNFGKFMDPLADKLLVISVMLAAGARWVLSRANERQAAALGVGGAGLRRSGVEGGKVRAAAGSGKIKTASTMVGFCLMRLRGRELVVTICWIVVVLTTVYSGVEYFIKNAEVFK